MTNRTVWSQTFLFSAWAGIVSAVLLAATAICWMVVPYKGLTVTPRPFAVDNHRVEQESLVRYTVRYCVDGTIPVPVTVNRELELQAADSTVFSVAPPISYEITERCEVRTLLIGIPSYLPPGKYHIHSMTELRVNPLRTIRQKFSSEEFQVVATTK